jgi:hypothetical protein
VPSEILPTHKKLSANIASNHRAAPHADTRIYPDIRVGRVCFRTVTTCSENGFAAPFVFAPSPASRRSKKGKATQPGRAPSTASLAGAGHGPALHLGRSISRLRTRRLSGPKRVQGMRCKNAETHEKQYRNNNIHDATLTMASSWARRCFRSVSSGPENGFVRPPGASFCRAVAISPPLAARLEDHEPGESRSLERPVFRA